MSTSKFVVRILLASLASAFLLLSFVHSSPVSFDETNVEEPHMLVTTRIIQTCLTFYDRIEGEHRDEDQSSHVGSVDLFLGEYCECARESFGDDLEVADWDVLQVAKHVLSFDRCFDSFMESFGDEAKIASRVDAFLEALGDWDLNKMFIVPLAYTGVQLPPWFRSSLLHARSFDDSLRQSSIQDSIGRLLSLPPIKRDIHESFKDFLEVANARFATLGGALPMLTRVLQTASLMEQKFKLGVHTECRRTGTTIDENDDQLSVVRDRVYSVVSLAKLILENIAHQQEWRQAFFGTIQQKLELIDSPQRLQSKIAVQQWLERVLRSLPDAKRPLSFFSIFAEFATIFDDNAALDVQINFGRKISALLSLLDDLSTALDAVHDVLQISPYRCLHRFLLPRISGVKNGIASVVHVLDSVGGVPTQDYEACGELVKNADNSIVDCSSSGGDQLFSFMYRLLPIERTVLLNESGTHGQVSDDYGRLEYPLMHDFVLIWGLGTKSAIDAVLRQFDRSSRSSRSTGTPHVVSELIASAFSYKHQNEDLGYDSSLTQYISGARLIADAMDCRSAHFLVHSAPCATLTSEVDVNPLLNRRISADLDAQVFRLVNFSPSEVVFVGNMNNALARLDDTIVTTTPLPQYQQDWPMEVVWRLENVADDDNLVRIQAGTKCITRMNKAISTADNLELSALTLSACSPSSDAQLFALDSAPSSSSLIVFTAPSSVSCLSSSSFCIFRTETLQELEGHSADEL